MPPRGATAEPLAPSLNDLMIATVVNFAPYAFDERKPGLIPGSFTVPQGVDGLPGILHVADSKFDVYAGNGTTIRVSTPPHEVARSIVEDHIDGILEVVKGVAQPGIFWVPGRVDELGIMERYPKQVHDANVQQQAWFQKLVSQADDDWQRYRQHKMISGLHKKAAKALKLDREWLLDREVEKALSECPACFSKVNPKAAFCWNCKVVLNANEAQKFQIAGQMSAPPIK